MKRNLGELVVACSVGPLVAVARVEMGAGAFWGVEAPPTGSGYLLAVWFFSPLRVAPQKLPFCASGKVM